MTEYIEREAAIRATDGELEITGEENMMAVAEYIQGVVQKLKQAPGIDLIMCRDCKYCVSCYEDWMCTHRVVRYVKLDDFCSWGEREEHV